MKNKVVLSGCNPGVIKITQRGVYKYKTFENHKYVNFKTLERKNIFNKCEKRLISIFKYIRKITQIAKRSKNMNDKNRYTL